MPRIKSGIPEDQSELSQLDVQSAVDDSRPNSVNAERATDEGTLREPAPRNETGAPPES